MGKVAQQDQALHHLILRHTLHAAACAETCICGSFEAGSDCVSHDVLRDCEAAGAGRSIRTDESIASGSRHAAD